MRHILFFLFASLTFLVSPAQRTETILADGWKFHRGEAADAAAPTFDDRSWQSVTVPHDWAITGPFSRENDLQIVAVTQNGESKPTAKTGRTGGLPYMGTGWYRRTFRTDAVRTGEQPRRYTLLFEGAMSEARVYVNGKEAIFWPYGYNSFSTDVTALLRKDGGENLLAVRLENRPQSARWYPGAGLYRNVRLIGTSQVHVPVWGTQILTPQVHKEWASVTLRTTVEGADTALVTLHTRLLDPSGKVVGERKSRSYVRHGALEQHFIVQAPQLWSPESPARYRAVTEVWTAGKLQDTYETPFGIRSVAVVAGKGFLLNGEARKFQGVCLHHDLGPLGAAVNENAIRHQLTMLKDMGADAVRTSHNMPAEELVRLCDEIGLMVMVEPFDEWDIAKCENGYHRFFNEWAERDMVNMLRHYRNNPSVVMWSIGNEVPSQCSPQGYRTAKFLQDICHREDPTRPVTCGMDQVTCVLENGFAALLDVPGFNYRVHRYEEGYEKLPQQLLLGSETASTVSSRGVYHFPLRVKDDVLTPDHQSSGYDTEFCSWSNIPDMDFARAEDFDYTLGQFVWTGFDYLGEPSPYDTDAWPNHSSLFGIIDLASLPKDRYYLYRSVWNKQAHTLHLLPHWTWHGREGQNTPVMAYTDAPSAELFLNGRSLGRRTKSQEKLRTDINRQHPNGYGTAPEWQENMLTRYRLIWDSVPYQAGELRVVAYDDKGNPVGEKTVRTAGKPHRLRLTWANAGERQTTGIGSRQGLRYVTVSVVDKDDNLCPADSSLISFRVKGAARFRAAANGSPTSLDAFQEPRMHAFSGQCTVILAIEGDGSSTLTATAKGLQSATLTWK